MYVHVFVAGSQVVPWRRGADADRGAYAARSSAAAFLRPSAPSRRCAPPPRLWTARAAFAPVAVSTEVTQFGCANPRIRGSSAGTARNSAHSAIQPNFRSVVSISLAAARDRPSGVRIKCGCARSSRTGHVRLSHRHARRQRQGSDGATRTTREGGGGGGGAGRSWDPSAGRWVGEGPLAAAGSRACAIQ